MAKRKVKNFFSKWQLKQMQKPTPEEYIETSDDGLKRVNTDYAKRFANKVLGHNFDTEVLSNHYYSDRREACICLKMKIRNEKGDVKKMEQFGGFTFKQGEKTSLPHAFKSAETNAFIKILFDLGFFQDIRILNKNENLDKEVVEQEVEKKTVTEITEEEAEKLSEADIKTFANSLKKAENKQVLDLRVQMLKKNLGLIPNELQLIIDELYNKFSA